MLRETEKAILCEIAGKHNDPRAMLLLGKGGHGGAACKRRTPADTGRRP